jgi:hypothetical protein
MNYLKTSARSSSIYLRKIGFDLSPQDRLRSLMTKRPKISQFLNLAFLAFLLTFFISSCSENVSNNGELVKTELQTRTGCDNDPAPPFGCITTIHSNEIFTIRGCAYTVWYRVIECASGITIDQLVYTRGTTPACKALEDMFASSGLESANTLYDQVIRELTFAIQESVIKAYAQNTNKFRCTNGGTLPCTAATYAVGFAVQGCYNLCATRVDDGEGGSTWSLYESQCSDACCKKTTPFCIKTDGTWCYGTPVYTSVGGCTPVVYRCQSGDTGPSSAAGCRNPCNKL